MNDIPKESLEKLSLLIYSLNALCVTISNVYLGENEYPEKLEKSVLKRKFQLYLSMFGTLYHSISTIHYHVRDI